MGTGSKKHKGANAKLREKIKGKNQGPKRIGATKPAANVRNHFIDGSINRLGGKKAKKAKAREAAWAIIGSNPSSSSGSGKKAKFSY
jgi:hypothetical protein